MRALGRTAALATTVRGAVAQHERDALLLERVELAREVHESVMQRLFGVSMVLGSGREVSAADAKRSAAEVEAALGELRDALDRSLAPTVEPSRTTLRAELERLGRQYKAVPISVWWDPGAEVPEGLEPLAVSVLGEALRNAEKHADPTDVRIAITSVDGAFALEVRNDGIRRRPGAGSGLGLRLAAYESMQRGGMLEFGPEAGEWRVRLVLPVSDVEGFVAGVGADG
jgi:signal transduction histidine kinase